MKKNVQLGCFRYWAIFPQATISSMTIELLNNDYTLNLKYLQSYTYSSLHVSFISYIFPQPTIFPSFPLSGRESQISVRAT